MPDKVITLPTRQSIINDPTFGHPCCVRAAQHNTCSFLIRLHRWTFSHNLSLRKVVLEECVEGRMTRECYIGGLWSAAAGCHG